MATYQVSFTDEDVVFINEAASILMPMYKAQQFLGRVNGQVEECRRAQKEQAREQTDAVVADRVAAVLKENDNRVVDFPNKEGSHEHF